MSSRRLKKAARSALRQVVHRLREHQKKDYQLLKEIDKETQENENVDSDAIYRDALARAERGNKRKGFYKKDINAPRRSLQRH
eukprot:160801-Karenia_brevis.AAC.1